MFHDETLTVDMATKDPAWLPKKIYEDLNGKFLEDLLFRDGGSNQGSVAWKEAGPTLLNEEAEDVAEFAEIPIADTSGGKARMAVGHKTALGIQVSWEMRKFNQMFMLVQQIDALKNTLIDTGVRQTLKAFENADIPTIAASAAWSNRNTSTPLEDILNARRAISSKTIEGPDGYKRKLGVRPDTLVLSGATLDQILASQSLRELYKGNIAGEHPLLAGGVVGTLQGMEVVTNDFLPDGDVYVMQKRAAGFISQAQPLTITNLYPVGGPSEYGGATQTFRMDAFRHRIIAVDNPNAVCKITGVE